MIPPLTPEQIDASLKLIVFMIAVYIPCVIYMDIMYREFYPEQWVYLWFAGGSITTYLYLTGVYPWYSFVISMVMCIIFYFVMQLGFLEGADLLFLCTISLVWVVNPYPYPHGLMQIPFYIYFAFTTILSMMYVFFYNLYKGNRWDITSMMSQYPRGFPYMITISAAFILSLVFG